MITDHSFVIFFSYIVHHHIKMHKTLTKNMWKCGKLWGKSIKPSRDDLVCLTVCFSSPQVSCRLPTPMMRLNVCLWLPSKVWARPNRRWRVLVRNLVFALLCPQGSKLVPGDNLWPLVPLLFNSVPITDARGSRTSTSEKHPGGDNTTTAATSSSQPGATAEVGGRSGPLAVRTPKNGRVFIGECDVHGLHRS